ncbi:hypothetical protein FB192DRAFT_1349766 [Mucor lusitanicus]|uniref:Uncharacterized protein n=1 Tax=Mucor circinelloides f. lusitanicus TaxID=29924 RepID=A0A8H4F4S4_MUCCL|nr:hypothetical protein FB192DRAFT_1349766 [Mucor lusitanicus]
MHIITEYLLYYSFKAALKYLRLFFNRFISLLIWSIACFVLNLQSLVLLLLASLALIAWVMVLEALAVVLLLCVDYGAVQKCTAM